MLVLQKVPPAAAQVRSFACDHPFCDFFKRGIPGGTYRLSIELHQNLELEAAPSDRSRPRLRDIAEDCLKTKSTQSRGFFCLTCLEGLFSPGQTVRTECAESPCNEIVQNRVFESMCLDGSQDRGLDIKTAILGSAQRMLTRVHTDTAIADAVSADTPNKQVILARPIGQISITGTVDDKIDVTAQDPEEVAGSKSRSPPKRVSVLPRGPRHPAPIKPDVGNEEEVAVALPSNSKQGLSLRERKGQETEQTLMRMAKVDRKRELWNKRQKTGNTDLPELRLRAPVDLMTVGDIMARYRKEGLMKKDSQRERKMRSKMTLNYNRGSPPTAEMATAPISNTGSTDRYCYCLRTDDGAEMLQCHGESCPVAWIHTQCSGMRRPPYGNEAWYCEYCSEVFGLRRIGDASSAAEHTPPSSLAPNSGHATERKMSCTNDDTTERCHSVAVNAGSLFSCGSHGDAEMDHEIPTIHTRQTRGLPTTTCTSYDFLGDKERTGKACEIWEETGLDLRHASLDGTTELRSSHAFFQATSACKTPPTNRTRRASTISSDHSVITPTRKRRKLQEEPVVLTPTRRHSRMTFSELAPFIYPETRVSAAALSKLESVVLKVWKTEHQQSCLLSTIEPKEGAEGANNNVPPGAERSSDRCPVENENLEAVMDIGNVRIDLSGITGDRLSQRLQATDAKVGEQLRKINKADWEQGVEARLEAVKRGKAKSSWIDEKNGVTSLVRANELRRRIAKGFSSGSPSSGL